jgi:hypothetical protein
VLRSCVPAGSIEEYFWDDNLYQKGAYGYGGERQDDEGSERSEALSKDLSPAGAPPLPPLEAACKEERRFLGANRKPPTFVRFEPSMSMCFVTFSDASGQPPHTLWTVQNTKKKKMGRRGAGEGQELTLPINSQNSNRKEI